MRKLDIIGQRFGMLVVLSEDPERKNYMICQCDCGNIKSIRKWSLTTDNRPSRSCGCQSTKSCYENTKKSSEVDRAFTTHFGLLEKETPYSNNKTGHYRVYFDKRRNKWCADISVQRKRVRLGRFDTLEDAIKARSEAVEKYHIPVIELKNQIKGEFHNENE